MAHSHSEADRRNRELHRVALEKLQRHPELLASVLSLLEKWLRDENLRHAHTWLGQWQEMLTAWPFAKMRSLVLDDERGQVLRQCSPLGPVLTPQERWRALAQAGTQASSEAAAPPG
jgi:hypothetical protein